MPSIIRSRLPWATISLLAGLALTGTVSAQDVDVAELQRNPAVQAAVSACMADRERLCSGVLPGGGRIVRCLASQAEVLSPSCRSAMDKASAALIAAGVALTPGYPTK